MRIPFIRTENDKTPLAWWEYLLAPVVIPAVIAALLALGVASVPFAIGVSVWTFVRDWQLRRRLTAIGRFMPWAELEPKLHAGEGTLIVEFRGFKLPDREWWVEADLISAVPCRLPKEYTEFADGPRDAIRAYARQCVKLIDPETGTAKMTRVRGRTPSEAYPKARILDLSNWDDDPILFVVSAE